MAIKTPPAAHLLTIHHSLRITATIRRVAGAARARFIGYDDPRAGRHVQAPEFVFAVFVDLLRRVVVADLPWPRIAGHITIERLKMRAAAPIAQKRFVCAAQSIHGRVSRMLCP